jgi:hypothetical protein
MPQIYVTILHQEKYYLKTFVCSQNILCYTFPFNISTSLGILCNLGEIGLAKGAYTSCNLLVISKIARDLLILVSSSLAKTPTIGFLYAIISASV